MEPFRYHAFVCTQEKPDGATCCAGGGSTRIIEALHRGIGAAGLSNDVQVSNCGCLGLCESGPVMIVYPEGTWYTKLTAPDVAEIVSSHLKNGEKVARLVRTDAAAMKDEIIEHRNKYLEMLKRKAAGAKTQEEAAAVAGD
jgi:(2Fe-2S) ferredoxin